MNQQLTAQLSVDVQSLVLTLRKAFDQKSNVVKELAQNARRAGASFIKFSFDEKRKFFAIEDDGCGIDDFNTLLAIARSGWSDDIKVKESPYGLGFLSCLYSADTVTVISNGMVIETPVEDVLNFRPVVVSQHSLQGKTIIIMKGEGLDELFRAKFEEIFTGFHIPVFVNDAEINRHHALNSGKHYVSNDHGQFSICRLSNSEKPLDYAEKYICYYQGFPIYKSDNYYGHKELRHIIHLNCEKYDAVAPDRHKLIEEAKAVASIKTVLDELIREDIKTEIEKMDVKDILESEKTIRNFRLLDIFNSIDLAPRSWFLMNQEYPILSENQEYHSDYYPNVPGEHVSKIDILSGVKNVFESTLPEDVERGWDDSSFEKMMYVYQKKCLWLSASVPEGHWLRELLLTPETIKFKAAVNQRPSVTSVDNGFHHGQVFFCDHYEIDGPLGVAIFDSEAIRVDISHKTQIFIPMNEKSDDILLQVNSYEGEYHYDENEESRCSCAFTAWLVNERASGDPVKVLSNILEQSGIEYPVFMGKSFTLEYTSDGKLTVKDLANATC